MKLNIFFGCVLIAFAAQQSESAPLESILRDGIIAVLKAINGLAYQAEDYANDYFVEKLQNHTQIQEWSVDIQAKVVDGIANAVVNGFEAYKAFALLQSPSADEIKLLNCVSEQEPALLAAIDNATRQNGWCNNRLASNLTTGFQEVTSAALNANKDLSEDIDSYKSCIFGDDICTTAFVAKVAKVVVNQFGDDDNTIKSGLNEVERIYKIMFGQDVPRCGKAYFLPLIEEGVHVATSNFLKCNAA